MLPVVSPVTSPILPSSKSAESVSNFDFSWVQDVERCYIISGHIFYPVSIQYALSISWFGKERKVSNMYIRCPQAKLPQINWFQSRCVCFFDCPLKSSIKAPYKRSKSSFGFTPISHLVAKLFSKIDMPSLHADTFRSHHVCCRVAHMLPKTTNKTRIWENTGANGWDIVEHKSSTIGPHLQKKTKNTTWKCSPKDRESAMISWKRSAAWIMNGSSLRRYTASLSVEFCILWVLCTVILFSLSGYSDGISSLLFVPVWILPI